MVSFFCSIVQPLAVTFGSGCLFSAAIEKWRLRETDSVRSPTHTCNLPENADPDNSAPVDKTLILCAEH
ncbi:hypothetical protein DNTS_001304, partial [Danionella cerebrum]